MSTSPPTHLASIAFVALGGALGALARQALSTALPGLATMPTGTLFTNLLGCFLLGFVAAKVGKMSRPPAWLQQGVGVGLLGSFTSTSTFASEAFWLLTNDTPGLAATYLASSLIGGLALAALGARQGGGMTSTAQPSPDAGGEA